MHKSSHLVAFVLVAFVANRASCISPEKASNLKKLGFVGGVPYSPDEGFRSAKAMSLWLSPDTKTQPEAMDFCKNILGGKLVSILNKFQDDDVKMALYSYDRVNEYWTSGVWNAEVQNWKWFSIDVDMSYYNNFGGLCTRARGYGVTTRYNTNDYKWCSAVEGTRLKYICQV